MINIDFNGVYSVFEVDNYEFGVYSYFECMIMYIVYCFGVIVILLYLSWFVFMLYCCFGLCVIR